VCFFFISAASSSKSQPKDNSAQNEAEESTEVLPEGFFDDPKLDAKVKLLFLKLFIRLVKKVDIGGA